MAASSLVTGDAGGAVVNSRRAGGWGVLVALLGLLLLGCTDDPAAPPSGPDDLVIEEEPDGPLGAEAVVVLPPSEFMDPDVHRELAAVVGQVDVSQLDGLRQARAASPESAAFVGDFARSFGEDGVEVVCLLGSEAHAVAAAMAELYPATRFCVVPTDASLAADEGGETPEAPAPAPIAGVRATVDLAVEDLGRLVGAGVRAAAGDGPVGLVLSGRSVPPDRFAAGLLAALGGLEVIEAEDPDAAPGEQAEALLAAGATVVVVDGGPAASAVVEALAGRAALAGPAAVFDAAGVDALVSWRVRWELAVARAIAATLEDQPVALRLGVSDGVFRVRAHQDAPAVAAAVDAAASALHAGLDPPQEVPPS